ncbi:hypothetical protein SGQ83_05940 [Flavobacterium sp. Fl-318]|uniref:Lipoprotein n=1 Tax=Flavobacterium cupriresistens TaxID=2893885 RepID=A0ABU4R8I0_9FLAO|nr:MULTISPECIES: hypothetical protein [unclassified Flavobacterium]MDX6188882.1 hypothetical protein [Flavobacterium sp. Fl-318]UFH44335.1 hypothetical protein LNP23_08965 [Flavobacterium sp. F-323]
MKIKNAIKAAFIFSIAMLTVNCETEKLAMDEQAHQTKTILAAKTWFKEYESNGKNFELVQNLQYDWAGASLIKSEDGTPTIVVPIIELKKDEREFWEQKLYIYNTDKDKYSALLFEAYSNQNIKPESQSVDGGDFTGYMTVWDFKKGAVRAAKFVNNLVVEDGVATFSINRNMTGKAPPDAPCNFVDFGDGYCQSGTGDGIGNDPFPLRPVIITGPKHDPKTDPSAPVVYTPRPPVTPGGTTPGGYTSPGGSGGGGGGTANPAANPCDKMKALTDVTKTGNMKPFIDWLKGKVMASVNKVEHGVEVERIENPDGTFKFKYTQVSSTEQFTANLKYGFNFFGTAHSHPENSYAMFSFLDVKFLGDAYDKANPEIKADVFSMVVVKDDNNKVSVYAMRVNDFNALKNGINSIMNNPKYSRAKNDDEKIDLIHTDQALKYENSGDLEKTFLKEFGAFGISFYKADELLTEWKKLQIDKATEEVTPVPCT